MAIQKKLIKSKQLKKELDKEIKFLQNIFAIAHIPIHKDDENEMDFEIKDIKNSERQNGDKITHSRANSIAELEDKLLKIKSNHKFNMKRKLAKKSLNSKLNKKIKKNERVKTNKNNTKIISVPKEENKTKPKINNFAPKQIFNNEGKLVFSKFDFATLGDKEKHQKVNKDPKKILDNLKQQEEKLQKLSEIDNNKAKELKDKLAWKNILQKAEGEKVKDDPTLLKKSIKKIEQKKKVSKKKWDARIDNVAKKKQERQNKRKENISKKKKEKKTKVVKAAVKRGRVVI